MTDQTKILDAIAGRLKHAGVRTVLFGSPSKPPRNGSAHIWYAGEEEKSKTLSNVMVTERVRVRVYWKRPESNDTRSALEGEVWTTAREIQKSLRADSDLDGNVTDTEISLTEAGYTEISGSVNRTVGFDVLCQMLEEEPITA